MEHLYFCVLVGRGLYVIDRFHFDAYMSSLSIIFCDSKCEDVMCSAIKFTCYHA
jgi:hypothetical protein